MTTVTPQNCGSHDTTCSVTIPGWKSGTCTDAACVATECKDGYTVDDTSCTCAAQFHKIETENAFTCEVNSLDHCGDHDVNCAESVTGWKDGTCTDDVCVATECNDGYHVYQNACEQNEISACGSHDNDCAVTQTGWKTGVCQNGACQALTCIENMHTEEGLCVADDAEHCGTTQINCA